MPKYDYLLRNNLNKEDVDGMESSDLIRMLSTEGRINREDSSEVRKAMEMSENINNLSSEIYY